MLEVLQDISTIAIWIVGVVVIGLVLLQGGAGDVGSAFGGGGQLDGALGVGANKKLAKITGWLSFLFIVMIVILAIRPSGDFTAAGAGAESASGAPAASAPLEAEDPTDLPPPALIEEGEVPALVQPADEDEAELADPPAAPPAPPADDSSDGSGVTFGDLPEDDAAATEAEAASETEEEDETNEDN